MPGIFACFDVETTSLDPKKGHIIEIAVVKIDALGEVHSEWASLVGVETEDLGRPDIHGITHQMLQGAPTFSDIAGDLMEILSGCIPVAHNAGFDQRFVLSEWAKAGLGPLELEVLDTLALARSLGLPGKLGDLAESLGVPLVDAHQALDDTRALAGVLVKLIEKGAELGDLYEFQPPLFKPEPSGLFQLRPTI
ncbi:MAG: hypothetical protein CL420_01070 [Acidimicrobiaceae bacterium]|jgi:DNA polymerase III epsilon subunit-like protein|nr:hypothetical protein [Acidimicrobiaceae bacterium]|tara:strand:- start:1379 stop:1960 length:582 start_codon:yes stop_codon:yes gene_type:complete